MLSSAGEMLVGWFALFVELREVWCDVGVRRGCEIPSISLPL